MDDGLSEGSAYDVLAGCPTLTFLIDDTQQMIPYHSFKYGTFLGRTIVLDFAKGTLVIKGNRMEEMWKFLQLQDVRLVRCFETERNYEVEVKRIRWFERKKEKS